MAMSFHQENQTADPTLTASETACTFDPYTLVFEVERDERRDRRSRRGSSTGTISPLYWSRSERGRGTPKYASPVEARSFYRKVLR